MLSIAERHKFILDELGKNGFIRASDIAKKLDVSVVTIRKDLKYLENKNLLSRTHGSASPVCPRPNVPDVSVNTKTYSQEKARIACKATKMIDPDDSIIIASGSTAYAFAERINPDVHLDDGGFGTHNCACGFV